MKKLIMLALVLILVFSLAACGESTDKDNSGGNSTNPPASQGGTETPSGNNGKSPSDSIADWPSQLPKLPTSFTVLSKESDENGFMVSLEWEDVTLVQLEAYVSELKAAGYTDIENEENEKYGENLSFKYFATNSDGYNVELYFYGQFYIQLWFPAE